MAYTPKDSDLFYTHLFEDNRGNLWQSSHLSDFYLFKKTPRGVKRFSFISPCGAPVAFFQERRNQLLIVCMFGMLYYDMQTGKLSEADFDFGEWKGNITINAATLDHLGNLYLGTSECGVLIVKAGSKTVKAYETQNDQRFDLSTAWVNSIMEDKDQNLWVGCYKKGLYLINNQKEVFNTWNFSSQNFVIGNGVSSMANDDGGGLWCVVTMER
jgi:ligand-binding sensor domain-containing protein